MALNVLTNVDMNKNVLISAVIDPLDNPPTDPVEGQIYFNTVDKKIHRYNGQKWVVEALEGGLTNVSVFVNDAQYQSLSQVTRLIATAIAESGHASFRKVSKVPTAKEAQENILYLVMNQETGYYDIYAKVQNDNGEFEVVRLDDVTIDLSDYVTKELLAEELNKKVDKVPGKELSTNDYSTAEKMKLSKIADGAQVNVIESIKRNGTVLTPDAQKAVDIMVPTKTSEITNDSNYITKDAVTAENFSGILPIEKGGTGNKEGRAKSADIADTLKNFEEGGWQVKRATVAEINQSPFVSGLYSGLYDIFNEQLIPSDSASLYTYVLRLATHIVEGDTLPGKYTVDIGVPFTGGNVSHVYLRWWKNGVSGDWIKLPWFTELPTKTSQLTNDSNFTTLTQTQYNELVSLLGT